MSSSVDRFLGTVSLIGTTSGQVYAEYDYTHPAVAEAYAEQIEVIYELYSRVSSSGPTIFSQTDADNASQALATLVNLAQNGLLISGSDSRSLTKQDTVYFLTKEMASNLDLLIRSFKAVGASDPTIELNTSQLDKWKDLSVTSPSIQDLMIALVGAIPSNQSLQAMIELQYVSAGNDMIADQFSSLQEALTLTNNILVSLTNLQSIRNLQVVRQPSEFEMPSSSADDFEEDYRSAADAHFDNEILPRLSSSLFTLVGVSAFITERGISVFLQLAAIRRSLMAFVSELSATSTSAALQDPNSLYNRVKQVVSDFDVTFNAVDPSYLDEFVNSPADVPDSEKLSFLQHLLRDNNGPFFNVEGRSAGDGQQNLTFAITSAQNLNDTQKEKVRQFLFVFEEYYKSASAILQRISQIVEKMAQNISR